VTVIIHAGLKKCGSSSIHAFLGANREVLRTVGISYPGPGRPGTDLANEVQHRRKFDASQGTLARLAAYWTDAPEDTLVLSSEMLEETEQHQAQSIRDALAASRKEENFLVVLVIRDLTALMPSVYAQKVKDCRTSKSFDDFFASMLTERRVNYFATASRWADVFGWENMRIRVLDPSQLINRDLLDDFLSIIGVGPEKAVTLKFKRPGVSNAAPGWRVVESVRALFTGTHGLDEDHPLVEALSRKSRLRGLGRIASVVGDSHDWNRDRGLYLTREQAEQCAEIYRHSVADLNRHLSCELSAPPDLESKNFREREFAPDATRIPRDELKAFYDDLWKAIPGKGTQKRRRKAKKKKQRSAAASSRALSLQARQ
jgi:hypothetical protein